MKHFFASALLTILFAAPAFANEPDLILTPEEHRIVECGIGDLNYRYDSFYDTGLIDFGIKIENLSDGTESEVTLRVGSSGDSYLNFKRACENAQSMMALSGASVALYFGNSVNGRGGISVLQND